MVATPLAYVATAVAAAVKSSIILAGRLLNAFDRVSVRGEIERGTLIGGIAPNRPQAFCQAAPHAPESLTKINL
jgi:hypothetical protein